MSDDPNYLESFIHTLADASGAAIMPYFRTRLDVDNKLSDGKFDPVTEGDRAGERAIRELIDQHHPDHGILGEEYGLKEGASAISWVIAPIDGTRAFMSGLPTLGTLIGAMQDSKAERVVNLSYFIGELAPHVAFKLDIQGMDNCFEAARRLGVKHTVFASSLAVSGPQSKFGERLVDETDDRHGAAGRPSRRPQCVALTSAWMPPMAFRRTPDKLDWPDGCGPAHESLLTVPNHPPIIDGGCFRPKA